MATENDPSQDPIVSPKPKQEPYLPFLEEEIFADVETEALEKQESHLAWYQQFGSPFLDTSESRTQYSLAEPGTEEYDQAVDRLIDREVFDGEVEGRVLEELYTSEEEELEAEEFLGELDEEVAEEWSTEFFANEEEEPEAEDYDEFFSEGEIDIVSAPDRRKSEGLDRLNVRFDPLMGFVWSVPQGAKISELTERELEVLAPEDTRVLVKNTLAVPYRWICALDIKFQDPDNGKWSLRKGTGVLIGARYVLTAAHVLDPPGGRHPAKEIMIVPARNGRKEPLGSTTADKWRASKNWNQQHNWRSDFDYGLITLKEHISFRSHPNLGNRPLGFWGSERMGAGTYLERLEPSVLNGKVVNVAGYPGDKCATEPLDPKKGCSAKDQGSSQWAGHGKLEQVIALRRLMNHTVDTAEGQSGSPVWLRCKHSRYLVGIHITPSRGTIINGKQQPPTTNIAVRITRELLREVRSWIEEDEKEEKREAAEFLDELDEGEFVYELGEALTVAPPPMKPTKEPREVPPENPVPFAPPPPMGSYWPVGAQERKGGQLLFKQLIRPL